MAWVSRCICSPPPLSRASALPARLPSACRHASGSAAASPSRPGSAAEVPVNHSAPTGSGARNAHTPASSAAAGS